MKNISSHTIKLEKRKEDRKSGELFAIIRSLNETENEENISLAIEKSETGTAIITNIPLPIGTKLEIRAGDNFMAIGEVTNWDWDPETDMVRIGMRLVEKHGQWPDEK